MNLPNDCSIKQVERSYRNLSKYTHPDKTDLPRSQELQQQSAPLNGAPQGSREQIADTKREVFMKINKAYVYLSNIVTKLIYDQYGIPGLIMYEKQKEHFQPLVERLRELDS